MNPGTDRQIKVRNLQRAVPVDIEGLEKFAATALQLCFKLPGDDQTSLAQLHEMFVILISDRRMARLHRQFLNRRGPTDVLTFDHGEIFISVETARRNARAFGNKLGDELRLYIVHGLLHLHGMDDSTERDARKMARMQQQVLARVTRGAR